MVYSPICYTHCSGVDIWRDGSMYRYFDRVVMMCCAYILHLEPVDSGPYSQRIVSINPTCFENPPCCLDVFWLGLFAQAVCI